MIRKLGRVALWALVFVAVPLVASADSGGGDSSWGYALGAGLAIGLAGLGCGIGQGITAGNTTAGIARNPGAAAQIRFALILGLALIESLVIYVLLIAFIIFLGLWGG